MIKGSTSLINIANAYLEDVFLWSMNVHRVFMIVVLMLFALIRMTDMVAFVKMGTMATDFAANLSTCAKYIIDYY